MENNIVSWKDCDWLRIFLCTWEMKCEVFEVMLTGIVYFGGRNLNFWKNTKNKKNRAETIYSHINQIQPIADLPYNQSFFAALSSMPWSCSRGYVQTQKSQSTSNLIILLKYWMELMCLLFRNWDYFRGAKPIDNDNDNDNDSDSDSDSDSDTDNDYDYDYDYDYDCDYDYDYYFDNDKDNDYDNANNLLSTHSEMVCWRALC